MRGVVCYYLLLCCLSLTVCARCGLLLFVVLFITDCLCEVWFVIICCCVVYH